MQAGLIASFDEYPFFVTPTWTLEESGDDNFNPTPGADGYSQYADTPTTVDVGVWLDYQGNTLAGTYTWNLFIPIIDYNSDILGETFTASGTGSGVEGKVIFYDLKIYVDLSGITPFWVVEWSDIKWFVGGVERVSAFLGGADSVSGGVFTPAGIPIIGIPWTISGGGGELELYANWSTLDTIAEYNTTLTVTATGGHGVTAYPVKISRATFPEPGLNCEVTPTVASLSAGTTLNSSVTGTFTIVSNTLDLGELLCEVCPPGYELITPGIYEPTGVFVRQTASNGSLCLMPSVPREFVRMNDDYAALIYRGGSPAIDAVAKIVCHTYEREDSCEEETVTSTLQEVRERKYDPQSDFLGIIENSAGGSESLLSQSSLAPYSEDASVLEFQSFIPGAPVQPGFCEEPGTHLGNSTICCFENAHYRHHAIHKGGMATDLDDVISVTFPLGGYLQELNHSHETAKYTNYICAPHWSWFLYFPQNSELTSSGWLISDVDTYWLPLRTQYLHHPDLGKSNKTRNHIVTEPLASGQLAAWIEDRYVSIPTSWLGISRFEVIGGPIEEDRTLDTSSEPQWTFTNCTASFAAGGITLTPTGGATSLVAEYNLGNYDDPPYTYPLIAHNIDVDWVNTNVAGVEVYLDNQVGDALLLATTQGTYTLPQQADSKFAGSWGQDFIDETGADIGGDGISAATLSDTEKAHSFQLFGGGTASVLRFEIEVTSSASTCELEYPTFEASVSKPVLIQETGQFSALAYPSGAKLRFGQHNYFDSGSELIIDTPVLRVPGELSTEPDTLAFYDHYFHGDAVNTTPIPWDAAEYADDADRVVGTHGFILPMTDDAAVLVNPSHRVAVVNSLRECPPIPTLPLPKRGASFTESGLPGLYAYTLIQEPCKYLSALQPIKFVELASGDDICTAQNEAVADWFVSEHTHQVFNDETISGYEVRIQEDAFANASPWHGYSAVLAQREQGSGVSICRDDLNVHHIAYANDDKIKVRSTNFRSYGNSKTA
jgi:hypothetical protein